MVFFAHFSGAFPFVGDLEFLNGLLSRGTHAPHFFFVVSGFLLIRSYESWGGKLSAFKYYGRRAFRIWPLLWVTVILTYILSNESMMNFNFVKNLFLLNGILPYTDNDLKPAVAWSLAIEEMYYLVMPIIGKHLNVVFSFIAVPILYTLNIPDLNRYDGFFGAYPYFIEFFSGITIYYFYKNGFLEKINRNLVYVYEFVVYLFLLGFYLNANVADSVMGLMLLVLALLNESVTCRYLLNLNFFKKIGQQCYSVYLLHPLVLFFAGLSVFQPLKNSLSQLSGSNLQNMIWLVLCLFFVVLISKGAFKFIEKPFTELGKQVFKARR